MGILNREPESALNKSRKAEVKIKNKETAAERRKVRMEDRKRKSERRDEREKARNKARMEGRPTRAFVMGFMRKSGNRDQPRDSKGRFRRA